MMRLSLAILAISCSTAAWAQQCPPGYPSCWSNMYQRQQNGLMQQQYQQQQYQQQQDNFQQFQQRQTDSLTSWQRQ